MDVCYFVSTVAHNEDAGSVGATVALAICVPLVLALIAVIVGYTVYIRRNPDRYGAHIKRVGK